MKLQAFVALLIAASTASAHNVDRHAQLAHKRQATTVSASAASSTTAVSASSGSPSATGSSVAVVAGSSTGSSTAAAATGTVTSSAASATTASATVVYSNLPTPDGSDVPQLTSISLGMASGTALPVKHTFAPGATPSFAGAPALPSPSWVFSTGVWPAQDIVVPTDSDEVKEWMKELDGVTIPDIAPTTDGTCAGSPSSVANASQNGWWTCGGYTRTTDILACPDKGTWGVSYDDGPSPYSKKLLNYLEDKNLSATFFVVGSRAIERPAVLIEEYMMGHEISVHTWSHPHLTSLTNEQIVGELGWTRKAIKEILGVTPTTMRCPYGDLDDRVRAIALAMGLRPIQWTTNPTTKLPFDTNDWRVAGGLITAPQQYETFSQLLGNASTMNTGFIVLEHDLFEVTVDLAIGYTIHAATTYDPPFTLKPIGQCYGIPTTDLYLESNTNKTFPATSVSATNSSTASSGAAGTSSSSAAHSISALPFNALFAAALAAICGSLI